MESSLHAATMFATKRGLAMHHQEQDHQSIMLHTAAVALMRADDSLRLRAIEILDQWMLDANPRSMTYFKEWSAILRCKDWDMALGLRDDDVARRQASPCACVLPDDQRLEIIAACKKQMAELGASNRVLTVAEMQLAGSSAEDYLNQTSKAGR